MSDNANRTVTESDTHSERAMRILRAVAEWMMDDWETTGLDEFHPDTTHNPVTGTASTVDQTTAKPAKPKAKKRSPEN